MSSAPITRQIAFFILAVLMPSAMLLAAGYALTQKESELERRRESDFRTFAARQASDSLLSVLERAFAEARHARGRWTDTSPRLLTVMSPPAPAVLRAEFRAFLRESARDERSLGAASIAGRYRQRLDQTDDAVERAFLMLALARTTGDKEWDRRLLAEPSSLVDDFGRLVGQGDGGVPGAIQPARARISTESVVRLLPGVMCRRIDYLLTRQTKNDIFHTSPNESMTSDWRQDR